MSEVDEQVKAAGRAFLTEIRKVCMKHNLSIALDHGEGAFILVAPYDEELMAVFMEADYGAYYDVDNGEGPL
jgi:hypothetical protein